LYAPAPGAGAAVGPGVEAAGDPRAWARALLVYEGQQRIEVPDGEAVFPAQALAPGGRLRRGQPSSMVVEPLYFREQQLGFVLFEVGPREGWVYETLRSQLSSPLQGALLVEREKRALAAVEEARTRAEVANRAKSAFLANMSHEFWDLPACWRARRPCPARPRTISVSSYAAASISSP